MESPTLKRTQVNFPEEQIEEYLPSPWRTTGTDSDAR